MLKLIVISFNVNDLKLLVEETHKNWGIRDKLHRKKAKNPIFLVNFALLSSFSTKSIFSVT